MSIYEKYGIKPYGAVPNAKQLEWYGRERMIFFHFGMNTFTDKEWGDGTEGPELFNPSALDVRQWIRVIKEAGFKCAILTAKHHDGFCLWQTKYTEHSIKNSPYKNGKGDIVKEFTDACREFGIKAGIYLSPWDRHEKSWGSDEYNDFYVGQLTELLTNYGKIWECWWDGAGSTEAVYDWKRWAKTVKTLQPDAVIFGSLGATPWVDVRWVGNEKGIAGKPCYATIDEISLVVETTSELNRGKIGGERFIPAEVDVSIRPGWFYHASQDSEVRSAENLLNLWFTSNGSNAGFLLNLPPDRRGLIHENDIESLLTFNKMLQDSLSVNLADNAKITPSSIREGLQGESLLVDDGSFYAPTDDDKCPELIVELESEKSFNSVMIREAIELGHKITGLEISAFADGEWKLICKSECVGYRLCERFDEVKSDKLKIRVTDALDTPIITFFGVYSFENATQNASNRKETPIKANVTETPDGADVNLGGIYPFRRIIAQLSKECEYTLLVFNGTDFEEVKSGKSNGNILKIELDTPIDYAYRFKLVMGAPLSNGKIEIY